MTDLITLGQRAKEASRKLATSPETLRNAALEAIAAALEEQAETIIAENAADLIAGRQAGLSEALLDRLTLTEERISGIAKSVREVIALPDPLGRILETILRPNGLKIEKISVPVGVIGVIYEARPNVTADSAALCLKSGNAVILRGGKEAIRSNKAIADTMRAAIAAAGMPADCVCLVEDTDRETANQMMRLNGYIDLLIPRGGRGLIQSVVANSTVPVIETGAGTCHTYVAKSADLAMAEEIINNAKTSRPSVCNACECMLIQRDIAPAFLPRIAARLTEKQVEIRGDKEVCAILPQAVPATEEDWGKEYNDYIIAAHIVADVDEAMDFIRRYGTMHSECIVTNDAEEAQRFLNEVDAAAVYWNASTRFTDGGEFGLGAEIGISTQKLHARGPLGLRELTSTKYRIYGNGQIR